MDPTTLLLAAKALLSWVWSNILDPRAWAVCGVVFCVGWMRGCAYQEEEMDALVVKYQAVGEQMAVEARVTNRWNKQAAQETENGLQQAKKDRDRRIADLQRQLRDRPREGRVSSPSPSPSELVQGSGLVCYDRAELQRADDLALQGLVRRINEGLDRRLAGLREGMVDLAIRGEAGADEARWWGIWARKVKVCGSAVEGTSGSVLRRFWASPEGYSVTHYPPPENRPERIVEGSGTP